jgi:hypothetical protein
MLPLFVSLLALFVVYSSLAVNTLAYLVGIHIVAMGAIFRSIARFLDRIQASVILIFVGFLFDSLNFSENFGMSVFLLLFLYGLHMSITDNHAEFEGRLDLFTVQVSNMVFFSHELFLSDKNFWELACLASLILSQIFAYLFDFFVFKAVKYLAKRADNNSFQVASNFFQK